MELGYHILEIALNNVEVYVLYKMLGTFLERKDGTRANVIAFVLLAGITHIKSFCEWTFVTQNASSFFTVLLIACYIGLSVARFYGRIMKKIAICLLYTIMQMASEMIFILILFLRSSDADIKMLLITPSYHLYGNILSKCLLCLFAFMVCRSRIANAGMQTEQEEENGMFIAINSFLCLLLILIYNYCGTFTANTAFIFVGVSFLSVTLSSLIFTKRAVKNTTLIMENNIQLQNMKQRLEQQEDMRLIMNDLRSLRHDMNNHMLVISGLLELGQIEELKRYVSGFHEEIKRANDFILFENETLSTILNYKSTIARKRGIDFDYKIVAREIELTDMEICTLFGNLLDNAIQANEVEGIESPYINLEIEEKKHSFHIVCENTYAIEPVIKGNTLVTTKKDQTIHGIGSKNVKNIVDKYKGRLQYYVEDGMFFAEIELPRKENE